MQSLQKAQDYITRLEELELFNEINSMYTLASILIEELNELPDDQKYKLYPTFNPLLSSIEEGISKISQIYIKYLESDRKITKNERQVIAISLAKIFSTIDEIVREQ